MLNSACAGPDPAISGYQTIAETYPHVTMQQVPYFDGDNWPDIIEDILKAEEKADEEERRQTNVKAIVDEAFKQAVQETVLAQLTPKCVKPRDAGGFYEGHAPPSDDAPRKRRKSSQSSRNGRPKASPDERLCSLMASIKRDFLVVKLRPMEPRLVVTDPSLPCMGDDHTVISFLRAERLEFSSLRHAKFSTMLLLRFLSTENKTFRERWPKSLRVAATTDAVGGPQDIAMDVDAGKGETTKKSVLLSEDRSATMSTKFEMEAFPCASLPSTTPSDTIGQGTAHDGAEPDGLYTGATINSSAHNPQDMSDAAPMHVIIDAAVTAHA